MYNPCYTKVTFKEVNINGCGDYAESRVVFYDKLSEDDVNKIHKILESIKSEWEYWDTDDIVEETLKRFGKNYEYDNNYIEIKF